MEVLDFIKSSVTIHDRSQIEFAFNYNLLEQKAAFDKIGNQFFEVEAFFFIPPQVGVNKNTYSKDHFYEDLRSLVRLREPKFSHRDLLDIPTSKLGKLKAKIQQCAKDGYHADHERRLVESMRSFCCSFVRYYFKRSHRRCRNLEYYTRFGDAKNLQLSLEKTESLVERSEATLQMWVDLYRSLSDLNEDWGGLKEEGRLILEYLSAILLEGLGHMRMTIQQAKIPLASQSGLLELFVSVAKKAHEISSEVGGISLGEDSSSHLKEVYLIRHRALRRRIWQVFFLDVQQKATFYFYKQIGYMMAAGFAATWAFAANIFIWHQLHFSGFGSNFDFSEGFLGFSGGMILAAFVLAYILKDRIKEWGRERIGEGLWGRVPDSDEKIWHSSMTGRESHVGNLREQMSFRQRSDVPKEILDAREKRFGLQLSDDEHVIRYWKKIKILGSALNKVETDCGGIRDIIRLHVRRFVRTLDDPVKPYLYMTPNGEATKLALPKSYPVDLVLRYSTKKTLGEWEHVALEAKRIMLNRKGVVKVHD